VTPDRDDAQAPRLTTRRVSIWLLVGLALTLGVLYGVVPQIPELRRTLGRLGDGDVPWLVVAAACEVASFAGYVVVFRTVFAGPGSPIGWRASYEITMAGVAATRLLAAGGAGGIALTGWAVSHAGMSGREVRHRVAAFLVLLYAVFLAAMLVAGLGLRVGLFRGPAPFGLTVVPAAFAAVVILVALALARVPPDLEEHRGGALGGEGRRARAARLLAMVPATVSGGVRGAIALLRTRRPGLLGAVAWWAFDMAVLWASLRAFGETPPVAVVVVAYLVGMLGNLLPLPGGVGGVEGGLVGALLGFGVPGAPAILAVLAYRAFAFWLPIVPGALAYVGLRRTIHDWDRGGARPAARAVRERPAAPAGTPPSRDGSPEEGGWGHGAV
jgi:uncharacterized membrane protein YbhN (UPF0104 family)